MAGVTGFEPVMTISKTVALDQTRRNPNKFTLQLFNEQSVFYNGTMPLSNFSLVYVVFQQHIIKKP